MIQLMPVLNISTIFSNLSPLGIKLIDAFMEASKDKKKAKEAADKLMYGVYSEIRKNLDRLSGYAPGTFKQFTVDSPECKELAAGLKVENMTKLLEQSFNVKARGKDAATMIALDKAVRFTENLRSLTELPRKLLVKRRKPRVGIRIKHIREQHIAAYNGLFKK